ncbi:DUF2336 domain-containing protein [Pelagibacterium luteolum]|uniref:Uncharacterized conserved protein, DUF2336 family n=1 Tax=Pelagibacterium luteolum TaxID=440168 RepID=A0A1G7XHP8_9HYPH|nr:DUF2336 domain-containing protein [Pelagibacterium luteolum]SDG83611.1 Uncharacterized conserved protein, DUF2336 family [Pelagibacterium luteolum]
MVAYQRYVELSSSGDSEERGQAAHLAAIAYLGHRGPADEHAALYAALMNFLDDPSVKVRAALAYGLLHSDHAPRPLMLALAQDAPVISRAVVQFSPMLLDADLMGIIRSGDPDMLAVITARPALSQRVALALTRLGNPDLCIRVLGRADIELPDDDLMMMAETWGEDPKVRGALFNRKDLPGQARLYLVECVRNALSGLRIVKGAIQPRRLDRMMRDACDSAATSIGEREAGRGQRGFVATLADNDKITARLMLHALVHGRVLFFADALAHLSQTPRRKVFTMLDGGSRAALHALFARCGFTPAVRNLLARMVSHARRADLADDVAARYFVVSLLIEELIAEHDGSIPPTLDEAFAYLNEQNIALARLAARGVMPAFADEAPDLAMLPDHTPKLALPAA